MTTVDRLWVWYFVTQTPILSQIMIGFCVFVFFFFVFLTASTIHRHSREIDGNKINFTMKHSITNNNTSSSSSSNVNNNFSNMDLSHAYHHGDAINTGTALFPIVMPPEPKSKHTIFGDLKSFRSNCDSIFK